MIRIKVKESRGVMVGGLRQGQLFRLGGEVMIAGDLSADGEWWTNVGRRRCITIDGFCRNFSADCRVEGLVQLTGELEDVSE